MTRKTPALGFSVSRVLAREYLPRTRGTTKSDLFRREGKKFVALQPENSPPYSNKYSDHRGRGRTDRVREPVAQIIVAAAVFVNNAG